MTALGIILDIRAFLRAGLSCRNARHPTAANARCLRILGLPRRPPHHPQLPGNPSPRRNLHRPRSQAAMTVGGFGPATFRCTEPSDPSASVRIVGARVSEKRRILAPDRPRVAGRALVGVRNRRSPYIPIEDIKLGSPWRGGVASAGCALGQGRGRKAKYR